MTDKLCMSCQESPAVILDRRGKQAVWKCQTCYERKRQSKPGGKPVNPETPQGAVRSLIMPILEATDDRYLSADDLAELTSPPLDDAQKLLASQILSDMYERGQCIRAERKRDGPLKNGQRRTVYAYKLPVAQVQSTMMTRKTLDAQPADRAVAARKPAAPTKAKVEAQPASAQPLIAEGIFEYSKQMEKERDEMSAQQRDTALKREEGAKRDLADVRNKLAAALYAEAAANERADRAEDERGRLVSRVADMEIAEQQLRSELTDARANDRTAMGYLQGIRLAMRHDGDFPTLVDAVAALVSEAETLRAGIEAAELRCAELDALANREPEIPDSGGTRINAGGVTITINVQRGA